MADEHAAGDASFAYRGISARAYSVHAADARYAIVVSRFNSAITDLLFHGAVHTLLAAGVAPEMITAVQVPGAVELPLAARQLAETGTYDGIVVVGCVIRGETAHFDYVCRAATDGVMHVQLEYGIPVGFGLATCETVEQAWARAGDPATGARNVGADAAAAALELAGVVRGING